MHVLSARLILNHTELIVNWEEEAVWFMRLFWNRRGVTEHPHWAPHSLLQTPPDSKTQSFCFPEKESLSVQQLKCSLIISKCKSYSAFKGIAHSHYKIINIIITVSLDSLIIPWGLQNFCHHPQWGIKFLHLLKSLKMKLPCLLWINHTPHCQ